MTEPLLQTDADAAVAEWSLGHARKLARDAVDGTGAATAGAAGGCSMDRLSVILADAERAPATLTEALSVEVPSQSERDTHNRDAHG
jgi:hypothetical protein